MINNPMAEHGADDGNDDDDDEGAVMGPRVLATVTLAKTMGILSLFVCFYVFTALAE